jgi:O-antigen ligase
MRSKAELQDYEPVTPSPGRRLFSSPVAEVASSQISVAEPFVAVPSTPASIVSRAEPATPPKTPATNWTLKRGHSLTYLGLFIFTFLVYFRPYELFPSLGWLSRSALVLAALTLAVFIPTQLGLENRISADLREVKLALALLVTGLLSVPLALEPSRAFQSLVEFFKVVVMFIVMVNVVRTEKRLRWLILLVLFVSCILSLAALNDYAHGNLAMRGQRIAGLIGGLFSNPNDLALHLVTMFPISFALLLGSRGPRKLLYLGCSLLLVTGMVATFSRAGFIGFVCVVGVLVWKLAGRNRAFFAALALAIVVAALTLAPGAYRSRLATTGDDSSIARTDDLKRSILVAARHPFFGVGMDNYILYSNTNHATHNSYTQVAAEMGLLGFLVYLGFLVAPFKGLRLVQQTTIEVKPKPVVYYLAIGLQAGLVGYMVVSFFSSVAYVWYAYYLVAYSVCLQRLTFADSTLKPQPLSNK